MQLDLCFDWNKSVSEKLESFSQSLILHYLAHLFLHLLTLVITNRSHYDQRSMHGQQESSHIMISLQHLLCQMSSAGTEMTNWCW
jgi:hypothetical protein